MGGFIEGLFGSESKEPKTSITPRSTLSPEQKALLSQLQPVLSSRVGQTAAPTSLETISLEGLENLASGVTAEGSPSTAAKGALTDLLTKGPTDFEDFFQTTVKDPALRDFERDIIPAIRERFAPQFFGGERREAEGRATEDLLRFLTQERSRLAFETSQEDTKNLLTALGLTPSVEAGPVNTLATLLGAGRGQRESLEEEELNNILAALSFLGVPTRENIVVSTPGREADPGILGNVAQTGAALGLAARLL